MRWVGLSASGILASSSKDRTLRIWKLSTGEGRVLARFGELRECGRVAISPDGLSVAYGGVQHVHGVHGVVAAILAILLWPLLLLDLITIKRT
jgi:WD40 repeat protein